LNPGSR